MLTGERPERDRDRAEPPTRRAPYSTNPTVGLRGLRTQQRILDAALQVLAEHGYDRTTLDKIAQRAGCSRVSIYQYFAGKDELFRQLAGQVARQMRASAESLDELTPDAAGARRAPCVGRSLHRDPRPVRTGLPGLRAGDAERRRAGRRLRTGGGAQHRGVPVEAGHHDLPAAAARPHRVAAPRRGDPHPRHRGDPPGRAPRRLHPRNGWPTRPPTSPTAPCSGCGPTSTTARRPARGCPGCRSATQFGTVLERADELELEATRSDRRALASLLDVGRDVVVQRGYQGVRVDDVVDAAGVSHGAFYRYFQNKDDLLQIVAVRALRAVSTALADVPPAADRAGLRRWLRRYNAVHAQEGAVIRVWAEAVDDPMRSDRAAAFDWGRRRVARLMQGRTFGDVDVDAVVLLAVIEAFGSLPRDPVEVDAAIHVIEHGFAGAAGQAGTGTRMSRARFSPMILRIHSSGRPSSCLV